MLSQSLACLRGHLDKYRHTGAVFDAPAVVAVIALLDAAIGDAEALEASAIAPAARLDDDELPANVVRLAAPRRRAARASPTLDGGAA